MTTVKLKSTITCPECGHHVTETMPEDACVYYWECPECQKLTKPKDGDCCVFCSYGNTPCPPVQKSGSCC